MSGNIGESKAIGLRKERQNHLLSSFDTSPLLALQQLNFLSH